MPKKAGKRIKCSTWDSAALCKDDEHCLWAMPGGPCLTRSQYKKQAVKLGLREAKPRAAPPKRRVGKGTCGDLLLKDLKKEATEKKIPGRSKMNKQALCDALGYE